MGDFFPLRDGYFKPLLHTPEEQAQWKKQVVELVERSLDEEQPLLASHYERVDQDQWKLIKTKDQLRVYRPRNGATQGDVTNAPCVLAVGTIEGTLEDVIYGIHNTSTRDIRVTRAFLSDTALDSAVLHVFENGTEDDPFRSFALKWRAVETPVGALVKDRDGCVLEYMGIDRDSSGARYAFQISENFDHPVCPPFTAQGVVRADVHIRAIYRELGGGRVGVYFRGVYDMSGHLPTILASWTAAAVAVSLSKSVECAEAKKLTALALSRENMKTRATRPRRGSFSSSVCSICGASPSYLSRSECQVCSASVCSKCCSRKFLLTDATKIKVNCCKQCIVDAKHIPVDARLPLKLASSAQWIRCGLIAREEHHHTARVPVGSKTSHVMPAPVHPDVEPVVRNGSPRWIPANGSHHAGSHAASAPYPSPPRTHSLDVTDPFEDDEHISPSSDIAPTYATGDSLHAYRSDLWMRMQQLRVTAEKTYHITKESNKLMGID